MTNNGGSGNERGLNHNSYSSVGIKSGRGLSEMLMPHPGLQTEPTPFIEGVAEANVRANVSDKWRWSSGLPNLELGDVPGIRSPFQGHLL